MNEPNTLTGLKNKTQCNNQQKHSCSFHFRSQWIRITNKVMNTCGNAFQNRIVGRKQTRMFLFYDPFYKIVQTIPNSIP